MNAKESKLLIVGDNVTSRQLPPGEIHTGVVLETNWMAVKIEWDDGQVGIIDHRGMEKIEFHGDVGEMVLRGERAT